MTPVYVAGVVNHLWQSTIFAGVASLATLALRQHAPRARYWLWVAASVKFLVPFSWLIAIGGQFEWRTAPAGAQPAAAFVVDQILGGPVATIATPAGPPSLSWLPWLAAGVWSVGCALVLLSWWRQWTPIHAALREARPLTLDARYETRDLIVMTAASALEPGIVGIWRPVLLVPDGLVDQLTPAQMNAVLAHERSHLRSRDNVVATVHMAVEALFWFHPLVWWIGTRLVDERERACDEGVLRSGHEPRDYAEGILAVCRLTVRTPIACVSGVSGANLRRRIETIMARARSRELQHAHKAALIAAALAAVAGPMIAGVLAAPAAAQAQAGSRPQFEAAAIKRAAPDTVEARRGAGTFQANPTGRLHVVNNPVMNLITNAYSFPRNRVFGGPDWATSDRYDMEATAGRESTHSEMMQMLQVLLEDRFKLKTHSETRELPIYVLKVANGGARLTRSQDGACIADTPPNVPAPEPGRPRCGNNLLSTRNGVLAWDAVRITMADAAGALGAVLRQPVFDQTGLKDFYDISLELPPLQPRAAAGPADPAVNDSAPSIFTVIRERLGLTLEPSKGPLETLVIDRIERPTEN